MKHISVSDKELMMIIESMKFRLQWYCEQAKVLEDDPDARSDVVNDACFLEALLKDFERKLA